MITVLQLYFKENFRYKIMYDCWLEEPSKRPEAGDLLENFTELLENISSQFENKIFDLTNHFRTFRIFIIGMHRCLKQQKINVEKQYI